MEIGTDSLLRSRQTNPGPLVRVNVQSPWVVTCDTLAATSTGSPGTWNFFRIGADIYLRSFVSLQLTSIFEYEHGQWGWIV